jgi:hypothetical protein
MTIRGEREREREREIRETRHDRKSRRNYRTEQEWQRPLFHPFAMMITNEMLAQK